MVKGHMSKLKDADNPLLNADYHGFIPKPRSLWLVVYECRYDVIAVSADGKGFFAPGQDVLWGFSNVTEWVREIIPPTTDVGHEELV